MHHALAAACRYARFDDMTGEGKVMSSDDKSATEIMRAIGEAMRRYYGAEDWVKAKRAERPSAS